MIKKSTAQSQNRKWHNRPKERTKVKREAKPTQTGKYGWLDNDKTRLGRYMQLYVMVDGDRRRDGEPILEPVRWSKHNYRLYTYLDGVKLYAHEIAWVLEYGKPPIKLRFKDGNTMNYAIGNLEERGPSRPYQAQLRVGSEIRCLGSYVTKEEAVAAQDAFKALLRMGIVN